MTRPRHTSQAASRASELRREMTISEARVWQVLKNGQCGARFRRQVPIGIWIVDFASLRPRLALEIDDPTHDWRDEEERTEYMEAHGFPILRFSNHDVADDLEAVRHTVTDWITELKQGRRPR